NTRHYVHKYSIRTSYKEWIDQIGIFSHDNLKVSGYREENNKIELELEYENGAKGYKELCEVVNAHNKFVDENPDYFPNDIDILVINTSPSEYVSSTFYNQTTDALCDYSILGRRNTAKLQYMTINIRGADTETLPIDEIIIDIPVIVMKCSYAPSKDKYSFLSEFKNAEQVIFDFGELSSNDKTKVCDIIHSYLADVEIYTVISVDRENRLERLF
ncbi:hypothetical protein, partial [Butyrivibrio sp. INlla21]|uniref:hypothetical protein n=1 Tax=Butyrivibrio sp. INlla21 TaxID=1520811 RepID=UPI0008E8169C